MERLKNVEIRRMQNGFAVGERSSAEGYWEPFVFETFEGMCHWIAENLEGGDVMCLIDPHS